MPKPRRIPGPWGEDLAKRSEAPPSPIDYELAKFVADVKARGVRFPIKTMRATKDKHSEVEEVSVFLVRDPALIELLTETIGVFIEAAD